MDSKLPPGFFRPGNDSGDMSGSSSDSDFSASKSTESPKTPSSGTDIPNPFSDDSHSGDDLLTGAKPLTPSTPRRPRPAGAPYPKADVHPEKAASPVAPGKIPNPFASVAASAPPKRDVPVSRAPAPVPAPSPARPASPDATVGYSYTSSPTVYSAFTPSHENPAGDPGKAKITVFDGSSNPVQYDLLSFNKGVVTFGRDESNDIVIRSKFMSRRHGCIKIFGSRYVIEDTASANGLTFNSEKIPYRELKDGDAIRIDDNSGTDAGVLMVFSCKAGDEVWNTHNFTKIETTIGRDSGCDIVLSHVGVSRVHARIIFQDGAYFIHDNRSTNGTWINGRKISGRHRLKEKDIILITNSKLIFSGGKISYCTFSQGIRVDASHIIKRVDKGRKVICSDVSLNISPCELVAIIGGSGAGKSTIMNCISGYSIPTSGNVQVNGVDLYQNLDSMRNIIGYVPQQDIVFENLTVYDMLSYTASLRLPKDTDSKEKNAVIMKAIEAVELTAHKDTVIKRLSGGQKKRASIAVELISDPKLFFLDEPCSGLDPGTERNLMTTLKNMSSTGKTVIFVTHSTLNLHICDKIVFMGTGGKLCFCGSYNEALKFFGVKDMVDVYDMISKEPDKWQRKYNMSLKSHDSAHTPPKPVQKSSKPNWMHQVLVLSKRHLHIMFNDKTRLLLLLVQAPLLALLISMVSDGKQFEQREMTKSLLFALSCSAFWVGILNSIQEICKERNILKREYMTGLRLDSYIVSKLVVMGIVCSVQAFLLTTVFAVAVGTPDEGVILPAYVEMVIVTFLTAFSASATGLLVSALVKNPDRAMTIAPILLMPQLLFSGLIFELKGASKAVSWIAACRFSVEGYGTTANLNDLPTKLQELGYTMIEDAPSEFYTHTARHFLFALAMLCLFVIVFSVLAGFVLKNIKKENR